MTYTKCFEVWANTEFLGYEYDVDYIGVIDKTHKKFGPPELWNASEYTTKQLTKELDNGQ